MARNNKFELASFSAFAMGLGSSLYLPTPVGIIAMLDIAAYLLAFPMFLQENAAYPKYFRRLLILGVLWFLGCVISDFWRGTPFPIALKASMIIVDSLCLLIVGAWIARKTPRALPWFFIGASIASVVSLYHFQNGALMSFAVNAGFRGGSDMSAYLIEKQVLPKWVNMYLMAGVFSLRILFRLPWPICIVAFSYGGVHLLLHGGSRSTFLTFNCAAILMAFYVYAPNTFIKLFKKKGTALVCIIVAGVCFNLIYMQLAKRGILGESGMKKYEQNQSGEVTALDSRNDIMVNWPFLWRSPIIGAGTQMIDHWGYLEKSGNAGYYVGGDYIENYTFLGHSCIVGAWTANGILGLIFWAYVLWLFIDFLGRKCYSLGDAGPFILYGVVSMIWAVLFSPFGGFRGQVMLIAAFIAFMKDPRYMQWICHYGLRPFEKEKYAHSLNQI